MSSCIFFAVYKDRDLGLLFLSHGSDSRSPWLLPTFRARVLYCWRVAFAAALSSVWVFSSGTQDVFDVTVLIPITAVSCDTLTVPDALALLPLTCADQLYATNLWRDLGLV